MAYTRCIRGSAPLVYSIFQRAVCFGQHHSAAFRADPCGKLYHTKLIFNELLTKHEIYKPELRLTSEGNSFQFTPTLVHSMYTSILLF